jgi:hypothetical protein
MFEDSLKICRENSRFIKIWQEWRVLFMKTSVYFLSYFTHFFLKWEMFQAEVVEKKETHFCVQQLFFFFENNAFYEITWKNIVMTDRPQITIWRMCIACWILKSTNAHSEYVIFITFPLQQWWHEHTLNVTLYVHCPSCLSYRKTIAWCVCVCIYIL